ncbi:hypothetical protein D9M68_628850 [compost metagenome]
MRLLLLLISVLLLFSCGTRKVNINKSSQTTEVSKEVSKEISVKETDVKKEESREVISNDTQQEDTETVIEREYDLTPTGTYLKKETATTRRTAKVDKSKIDKFAISEETHTSEIDATEVAKYDSLERVKEKEKAVDADSTVVKNIGGWPIILTIILIAATIYFFRKL